MNKKGKLGKRIAAWFMCLAMVLSIVNLPGFTMTANAAPTSTVKSELDLLAGDFKTGGQVELDTGYDCYIEKDDDLLLAYLDGTLIYSWYINGTKDTSLTGESITVTGANGSTIQLIVEDDNGKKWESLTYIINGTGEKKIASSGPELIDRIEINYTFNNNNPYCSEGELYKELSDCLRGVQFSNGAGTNVAYRWPSIQTMYLYSYTGPERSGTRKQLSSYDTDLINPNLYYYLELKISAKDGYDFKHDGMKFDEESATFIVNGVERTDLYFGNYASGYKYVDVYIPIELDLSHKVYSITITNKETNVEKASTLQLATDIIYYGDGLDAIEWSVEGATSKDTAVDDTGLLTIGADEKSDSITVKATAATDSSMFAVKTFGVIGALSIESVTIDKLYENTYLGASVNFLATVEGSDLHDVIWTLTGNTKTGTTITQNGKKCTLIVARDEEATELILKVTSVKDPTKFATSTITVLPDTFIDRVAIDYTTSKATAGSTEGELYKELSDCFRGVEFSNGAGTNVAYRWPSIETMYLYSYTGPERSGTRKQLSSYDTNLIDPNLNYYLELKISAKAGYDFKHDGMKFDEESATFIVNGVERTDLYFGNYMWAYKFVDVYIPIHISECHNFVDGVCTVCGICQSVSDTGNHDFTVTKENPVIYNWSADGKTCSAIIACSECGEKLKKTCTITSAVKTPATYTEPGTTRYTAKLTYEGQTYKSTKDVADIAKLTLGKVTGLAVAEQAATDVTLKWNKLTGATGYILEKKDGADWTRVAKIAGGDVVTYKVTGLATGNTYSFRIRGYAYENGKTANGTNSATLTVVTKLPAITGVKVAGSTVNAIRLSWAKNKAVEGYQIEQLMADGSWKMIKKIVGADTLEYRISNLTAGTGYKFRIRGYNTVPVKTYSDYTNVVTCTKLPAMTNVKVAGRSTNAVRLSWDKNEVAEGYQIEKKVNGVWKLYKKITTADTLEYRITNLTSATAYDFRVRAYKVVDGCVSYSDYVTLNTSTK